MKIFTTNTTRFSGRCSLFLGAILMAASMGAPAAIAADPVNLGPAIDFAVLAGSGITNTGSSIVNGDIGSYPTATITGFPIGTLNGTNHAGDAVTQDAKTALVAAYDNAALQTPTITYTAIHDLGGVTLTPGVYNDHSSFGITGTLTLDAQGDPDAIFVFQAGSSLTAEVGSVVSLINAAQACNVFWQVGSSATLKTNSIFKGNILALTDITLNSGANVEGRVLARNGTVTLATNTITKPATPPILTVIKSALMVVNPTFGDQPVPGAEIEYTITVQVTSGSGTAQDMTIKDTVPVCTTYISGSMTLNGVGKTDSDADGDLCDYNSGTNVITVQLGAMTTDTPMQTIKFKVTVQ